MTTEPKAIDEATINTKTGEFIVNGEPFPYVIGNQISTHQGLGDLTTITVDLIVDIGGKVHIIDEAGE